MGLLGDGSGPEVASRLVQQVIESANIEVISGATVFAQYQDNLLPILHGDELVKLRAKSVVLATGTYEVPLQFQNNDLPGIMLATAAQRLIHLYGVKPGNIVGAIANEAKLPSRLIGPIKIHQDHSTVELPEDLSPRQLHVIRTARVCQQALDLEMV